MLPGYSIESVLFQPHLKVLLHLLINVWILLNLVRVFVLYALGRPQIFHLWSEFVNLDFNEFLHDLLGVLVWLEEPHPLIFSVGFALFWNVHVIAILSEYLEHGNSVLELLVVLREDADVVLAQNLVKIFHSHLLF